jgi:hypothetical protein
VTLYPNSSEEAAVIARVATFNPLPDVDPEAVALLRKTVAETPGFVAGYHLGGPGEKSLSIAIFDGAEAGRAASTALEALPGDRRVGIKADQVEYFEAHPFSA